MDLITSPDELHSIVAGHRRHGRSIALVPTMGALHSGHLSLIELARSRADVVVVSIFVNPLQFEDPRDFERYPRCESDDDHMCAEQGVDIVFRPEPSLLYPPGFATTVDVSGVTQTLEGSSRPGHFRGVATVVAKLFIAADPDLAVFGAKDYQQVAVIRRLTEDLGFAIDILVAPTVRESDGLAMSSRNVRLDSESRRAAAKLFQSLQAAQEACATGTTDSASLIESVIDHLRTSPLIEIDYVQIVDPHTLSPSAHAGPDDVLLVAAVVGGVRLIDNVVLGGAR